MLNRNINDVVNAAILEAENKCLERSAEIEAVDSLLGHYGSTLPIKEAVEIVKAIDPIYMDATNDLRGLLEYLKAAAESAKTEAFWLEEARKAGGEVYLDEMLDGAQDDIYALLTELNKLQEEWIILDPTDETAAKLYSEIQGKQQKLLERRLLQALLKDA